MSASQFGKQPLAGVQVIRAIEITVPNAVFFILVQVECSRFET
jgi:hypothetical protein